MQTLVTSDMVKRRILFDSMADPLATAIAAGLVGVSDEGAKKEEEDSHRRLHAVAPIFPALASISGWLAEVAANVQVRNDEVEVPDAFIHDMISMYETVIQGSLVATISVLNDLGMLTITQPEE